MPVADANASGQAELSDAVFLLNHLFLGGPAPSALSQSEEAACRGIDPEAARRGMEVFENPDPQGNFFSCALCHSTMPDGATEVLRPGHSLLNALGRPTFKGGALERFLDAANVCRVDWMVTGAWQADAPAFTDLVAFLQSVSTAANSPPLVYEIVPPATKGPAAGDAMKGCELFDRSCAICHARGGQGSNLAPSLIDPLAAAVDDPDYIRLRIRLSGPTGGSVYERDGIQLLGTVMPFWSKEKLSDAEVEDIAAFLFDARAAARAERGYACEEEPTPIGAVLRRGSIDGAFSSTGNRSPRTLHNVSGIIEHLDTREIRIREFNYDGGGIVVRLYLLRDGQALGTGQVFGPDLFRMPQVDSTLVVDLPPGVGEADFDWVSVWCVSARQDFGSARLAPTGP
jgi:cytochrome c